MSRGGKRAGAGRRVGSHNAELGRTLTEFVRPYTRVQRSSVEFFYSRKIGARQFGTFATISSESGRKLKPLVKPR
jgi:hypothetical protein